MAPFISRAATVVLAVLLVASVTDWLLTFSARRTPTEPVRVLDASAVEPAQVTDVMPVARLFGAASSSEVGGIRALGVMAEGGSGRGIAILGLEGKPAKSYRSGDLVAPGVITFFDRAIPAWFRVTLHRTRPSLMQMTAAAHFMVDRYVGFDGPVAISPPPSR